MTPPTAHLALWLDSPLQSWGYQSRFDRRTSLSYPTRSGVLGLVAAALGIDRADTMALRDLAPVTLTIYAYPNEGRVIDYHTVGGGYDRKTQRRSITRTADGKVGKTVLTRREYLQNARFGVVLAGPAQLVERIQAALHDPVWGVWLGRKSCIPADLLAQGTYPDHDGALKRLCELSGSRPVRVVREVEDYDDGTATLMTNPIDYANRTHGPQRIADEPYAPD
jgi:CRISPR system Cascade subunit CasD